MLLRLYDPAQGVDYVGPLPEDAIPDPPPDECLEAIYSADTTIWTSPPLAIPASSIPVQVNFDHIEICNSRVDPDLQWQLEMQGVEIWDLNCAIEGNLPVGWTTAQIELLVYISGTFFRRIDRRTFATGETNFFVGGSCQVYGAALNTVTIMIAQSLPTPQVLLTWDGWVDLHYAHQPNCTACSG